MYRTLRRSLSAGTVPTGAPFQPTVTATADLTVTATIAPYIVCGKYICAYDLAGGAHTLRVCMLVSFYAFAPPVHGSHTFLVTTTA